MADNFNNSQNDNLEVEDNTEIKEETFESSFDTTHEEEIPTDLADFIDNETPSYTKFSEKYDDMMSSASTMLFVGILGLIFLILVVCKVIPLPIDTSTAWLFDIVMALVFLIFVIFGIVSLIRAKQIKADADVENRMIDDIKKWADENITREILDENLDMDQPEELLYFSRADKIKDMIMHEFESTDEALISEMVEEVYQKLYEDDVDSTDNQAEVSFEESSDSENIEE